MIFIKAMSATIKYQNFQKEFITEQQALQLNDYVKLFYVDNQLKKDETYRGRELWGGFIIFLIMKML